MCLGLVVLEKLFTQMCRGMHTLQSDNTMSADIKIKNSIRDATTWENSIGYHEIQNR